MERCRRFYNGKQCRGSIPIEGDGAKGVCSLCSKPSIDPHERHAYYEKNKLEIINDIRTIGRQEARIKWSMSKHALQNQETLWVKEGLITIKEQRRWTRASAIIGQAKRGARPTPEPSVSSSDRGRKKTPQELQYSHRQLSVPLGLIEIGGGQLEITLKIERQDLVHKLQQVLDE